MTASLSEEFEEFMSNKGGTYGEGDLAPSHPGPAILGHQPIIGAFRRDNDIPVARERFVEELDELEGVDVRKTPAFPILNTR